MSRTFTRQEMYNLVWGKPLRLLCSDFGVSDVALKKACRKANVPTPPVGYWNKIHAGKKVTTTPLPQRGLGMSDRVSVGSSRWNYGRYDPLAPLPPEPAFDGDEADVRSRAVKQVGKVTIPRDSTRTSPIIRGKLSATELADPRRRLEALNRMCYASHVLKPGGYAREPGFQDWTFQQFLPRHEPLPGSPVSLDGHLFALRRPHDLSKRVFEKLLHHRLRNASLNSFLVTPAGRKHCAILGLVPEEQQRWTAYRFGRTPRIDKAEELYVFRPDGEDSDRLLMILERLVHDWVMGRIPRLPGNWRDRSQYSRRSSAA